MAHNNWRFFDNPLVGSWRHLPDDLSLQRGPTIVILPDGRRLRVPAMSKRDVIAPGNQHDAKEGEGLLKSLQAILQGKKAPQQAGHPGRRHHQRVGPGIRGGPGRPAGSSRVEEMPRPIVHSGFKSADV